MLKLGQVWNSVRGWVWVASTVLPAIATFASSVFEGLPWSHRILLATSTLAVGAAFAFYVVRGYEVVSGWWGVRQESLRAARQMCDLLRVGQVELPVKHAADIWAGSSKSDTYAWIVRLRQIKQAADLGLIRFTNPVNGRASKLSNANVADLERFFRERLWESLPPVPPLATRVPKSTLRTRNTEPRKNWVAGWRRP